MTPFLQGEARRGASGGSVFGIVGMEICIDAGESGLADHPVVILTDGVDSSGADRIQGIVTATVDKVRRSCVLPSEYYARAIPWFGQKLKVFVRILEDHDGRDPKPASVISIVIRQIAFGQKKSPARKG